MGAGEAEQFAGAQAGPGGDVHGGAQQTYLSSVDPDNRAAVLGWNNACTNAGVATGTSVLGALAVGDIPLYRRVYAPLLAGLPALEIIASYSAGLDNVDLAAARALGSWSRASRPIRPRRWRSIPSR